MTFIVDGTKGAYFSSWSTAGRPTSPATGQTGYNTSYAQLEVYNGTSWVLVSTTPTYSASYLVVAGGGAGGSQNAPTGHYH